MQVSKYYEYLWLRILKLFHFNSTHITPRCKIRGIDGCTVIKAFPHSLLPQRSQFLLPEFLGYLWRYLFTIVYLLSIVSITSKWVVKGPFTISRCLTRLCSPLSARILKSLFSSYSQSFRRAVEYNLGNLLAIGLFKSWKKWPWSFSPWRELPSHQLQWTFPLETPRICTDSGCWSRNTREADNGERWLQGLNFKRASAAHTEQTPACPEAEYSIGMRFYCFLGSRFQHLQSAYLYKKACRCEFVFLIPSVNQRD